MVYVELNPARANREIHIPCNHTSAQLRSRREKTTLANLGRLDLSLSSYIRLILWTHQSTTNPGSKIAAPGEILSKLGQSEDQWISQVHAHAAKYRAYGMQDSINAYLKKIGQRWIQMPTLRSSCSPIGSPASL